MRNDEKPPGRHNAEVSVTHVQAAACKIQARCRGKFARDGVAAGAARDRFSGLVTAPIPPVSVPQEQRLSEESLR